MGHLVKIIDEGGFTWAYDKDTKKIKKVILQDVPPSQLSSTVVEAMIDIMETGKESDEGMEDAPTHNKV
jgi:hypothetical protein